MAIGIVYLLMECSQRKSFAYQSNETLVALMIDRTGILDVFEKQKTSHPEVTCFLRIDDRYA